MPPKLFDGVPIYPANHEPAPTELSQQQVADLYRLRRATVLMLGGYVYSKTTNRLSRVRRLVKILYWRDGTAAMDTPYFALDDVESFLGPLLIRREDLEIWKKSRSAVRSVDVKHAFLKKLAVRNGRTYVPPEEYKGKPPNTLGDPWLMPETVARYGEVDIFKDIKEGRIKPNAHKGAVLLSDVVALYGQAIEFVMMSNGFYRRQFAEKVVKPDRNDYLTPREVWSLYHLDPDRVPDPEGATHFKLVDDVVATLGPLPFARGRVAEWANRCVGAPQTPARIEYIAVIMGAEERGIIEKGG